MKKIKFRHSSDVNIQQMFSAQLRGGQRGFADAMALESFSNDISPTIKTMQGFIVIAEPYDM